jgi:predicted nucleic acid-binding Zn ribbon protein
MTEPIESSDFAQEFYLKMRAAITGRPSRDTKRRIEKAKQTSTKPFEKGREPIKVAATIDGLIKDFNWESRLGEAELFTSWGKIVGEANAEASTPEVLTNKVLQVRCKSTAWAAQLRLIEKDILSRIKDEFPDLEIDSLKFSGPAAPSWKKGPRSVPGRGPRDTYG